MARYTGPLTKKSRRLGTDLVGNDKSFERRPYPPGVHGRGRTKDSEYSQQLHEKQKARYAYGVLEKQFRRYYVEADRSDAKTGDMLLQILESRLDNVVYRAGLAATRRQARQLVNHGHFLVNGKKVNISDPYTALKNKIAYSTENRRDEGIIGDLTSRRGQVTGQDTRGNAVAINAFVPLANMFGYINTLRSMSSGRAVFTMQFDHYEPVPQHVADEVIKKYA